MNEKMLATLLRLYLTKKLKLNYEIVKTRLECQRLIHNYRRNLTIKHQLILLLLDHSFSLNVRSTWVYKKNGQWWSEIVPRMSDHQFKENFRVERTTYACLIDKIGPYLEKLETNYRATIPVDKRIAIALYTLGSSSELRKIAHLFGIGRSTTGEILREFCSTLVETLFYQFIKFPKSPDEIKETINGFYDKFNYPMCIGSVDGTHIAIKPPKGYETDYYNYKKHHSIIMRAIVNSDLLFTYVNIGASGRCNDSSIYNRSSLSQVIEDPIYDNHYMMINQIKVRCHFIADSAFSLSKTLMKPFPERPNMQKEYSTFNYRLSRARCSVERTFGALKNRFRLLHKKIEYNLSNITNMVKAATILHNLCILNGDNDEIEWNTTAVVHRKPSCNSHTNDGTDVRNAIVKFFLCNPL
uniref:PIF/Harbinger-like protein n=1 Tax=Adineta vaga TaxID=104782 RepID=B3G4K0_ADIVA|nr:PIF/Harbinger-like protein [Adineta vaga]